MYSRSTPSAAPEAIAESFHRYEGSWQRSQLDDTNQNLNLLRRPSNEDSAGIIPRRASFTVEQKNNNQRVVFNRPNPIFNGKMRLI